MDFSSGNSGNTLTEAVMKLGPGCAQEGAFCEFLGPKIAPKIFALIPNGYVMEKLEKPEIHEASLLVIESALEEHVWCREAIPISNDETWVEKLKKYGINTDLSMAGTPCLAHGDPTLSNLLHRGGYPILADPRPPRDFIPQCKETDMGRILQSALGWEVAAYGWPKVDFKLPNFMFDSYYAERALFWAIAAATRILHLEMSRKTQNVNIVYWCNYIRSINSYGTIGSSPWGG